MDSRIAWLLRGAALLLFGLLLAGVAAACDDGGDGEASAEEIAAVEEVIRQLFEATPEDAEFVFAHATDNLFQTVFFTTREDCQANVEECITDPLPVESFSGTAIDGDTATSTVTVEFGTMQVGLVREDDVWKGDSLQATSDEVPEGAASVDISLTEFAFTFDEADIPADGNFVFHATNDGAQVHEIAVAPVPAEVPLEEALGTVDESTVLGFKVFIQPGQEVDFAFDAPLEAGRYAMVCFFPDTADPEGTPHAEKGMLAEFTIE